jgi:uncharacterized phiE125 gp8 family phage protein
MYTVKTSEAVTSEVVTLEEVKAHLKIDYDDENDLIAALIAQCRNRLETYCSISIGEQTKIWVYDGKRCEEEEIPYGPVNEIVSVAYLEDTNPVTYEAQTAGEDYVIDGEEFKYFNPLAKGRWKVTYIAGYTDNVPQALKLALLHEIAYRYENRGDKGKQFAVEEVGICVSAKILANPYRRVLA